MTSFTAIAGPMSARSKSTSLMVQANTRAKIYVEGILVGQTGESVELASPSAKLAIKAPGYQMAILKVHPRKGKHNVYRVHLRAIAPRPAKKTPKVASAAATQQKRQSATTRTSLQQRKKADDPMGMFADKEPDYAKNMRAYKKKLAEKRRIAALKEAARKKALIAKRKRQMQKARLIALAKAKQKRRQLAALEKRRQRQEARRAQAEETMLAAAKARAEAKATATEQAEARDAAMLAEGSEQMREPSQRQRPRKRLRRPTKQQHKSERNLVEEFAQDTRSLPPRDPNPYQLPQYSNGPGWATPQDAGYGYGYPAAAYPQGYHQPAWHESQRPMYSPAYSQDSVGPWQGQPSQPQDIGVATPPPAAYFSPN